MIEQITHDITAGTGRFTVADNLGGAFDRMEIEAAGTMNGIAVADAGARFVLTDLDFSVFL